MLNFMLCFSCWRLLTSPNFSKSRICRTSNPVNSCFSDKFVLNQRQIAMSSVSAGGKKVRPSTVKVAGVTGDQQRKVSRPKDAKVKGASRSSHEQGQLERQSLTKNQGTSTLDEGHVNLSAEDVNEEEEYEEDEGAREGDEGLSAVAGDLVDIPVENGEGAEDLLALETKKKIRPDYAERFRPSEVQKVIIEAVRKVLVDKEYAESNVQEWIKELTSLIKDSVKELGFPRYKLISHVTIGRDGGQGAVVASKCVWDELSDDYAFYSFSNGSIFCNAVCYGIYNY